MAMFDSRRDEIYESVMREFVGPIEADDLNGVRPQSHYRAGVLYPRGFMDDHEDGPDPEAGPDSEEAADLREESALPQDDAAVEAGDAEDIDVIDRSNRFRPTAMSVTVAVQQGDVLVVRVRAASYHQEKHPELGPRSPFLRSAIDESIELELPNPTDEIGTVRTYGIADSALRLDAVLRKVEGRVALYTIALENTREYGQGRIDELCYFQAGFSVSSRQGFAELPRPVYSVADDETLSNEFLYREIKEYAVGHGCACRWDACGCVREIHTTVMPSYETKPIVPADLGDAGISLSMRTLGSQGDSKLAVDTLLAFCDLYEKWIDRIQDTATRIEHRYRSVAIRNVEACRTCLMRMRDGASLVGSDERVASAFRLMNDAMLLQQLHYTAKTNRWIDAGRGRLHLERTYREPDPTDDTTWPEGRVYGIWRPFQMAFILMNLRAMLEPGSKDRGVVDLIWFPTGGGKTEAYLGLSAYAVFLRRLLDKNDSGTVVLMRYTLRLLTAQQYERAASLICACESLRRNNPESLGPIPFSIGLWVGSASTPNSVDVAVRDFNALSRLSTARNPFVVLKCPWCGAEMGAVKINGASRSRIAVKGYRLSKDGKRNRFVYQCDNPECRFSHGEMPLYVIDEEIYDKHPTLVIGTVDKFAMLPFRPEARSLFGMDMKGIRRAPPDLIVQDELHLISGPLGSMVGCYETLVSELCSVRVGGVRRAPKVVASTATISRAKAQCHALYACGKENVCQFPPPGITYRDSFFAYEDANAQGRRYVGVMAHVSSGLSTSVRLFASLLYAVAELKESGPSTQDPYWTIVAYYNTLRDLGSDLTVVNGFLPSLLRIMYRRSHGQDGAAEGQDRRRFLRKVVELTSRIPSDRIGGRLHELEIAHGEGDVDYTNAPIDLCLATNMISVGLDVSRLGLMTVMGQPKTTSEYIQATSRVGRSSSGPGLVFAVYRPERPRDRSIYENFLSYHSKLYAHVEPTSVTPFSPVVRERSLHAIVIALYRFVAADSALDPRCPADGRILKEICNAIEARVMEVSPDELDSTRRCLSHVLECWRDWNPQEWAYFGIGTIDGIPLMYARGIKPSVAWGGRGFPTMTSMRNVDAPCEVDVIRDRGIWKGRDEAN